MKKKRLQKLSFIMTFLWAIYVLCNLFIPNAYARSSTEIQQEISLIQSQIDELQNSLNSINLNITTTEQSYANKKQLYENTLKLLTAKQEEVSIAFSEYENSSIPSAVFSSSAISAEIYNDYGYGNRPPLPGPDRLISTQNVENINFQWGSGPVLNTLYDRVAVKFTGTITTVEDKTISFYAPGDDGVRLYINNSLIIDDWYDKGGGGSMSQSIFFKANEPKTFTLWFYENGGGANVWLYWNYNGYYEIVPTSAFATPTITYIKDPALLDILNTKQDEYNLLQSQLQDYNIDLENTKTSLDSLYQDKLTYENKISDLNIKLVDLNKELQQALIDESTPPWYSNEVYENQDMTISLDNNLVFSSVKAWYGSPTDKSCGADVSTQVFEYFKDKQSATINANNGVFGDPCGGVVKVLRVSYETREIPIITPTPEVTPEPTPTPSPSPEPSIEPSPSPVVTPTPEPSIEPTPIPTPEPSLDPVSTPTPSEDPAPVETPVVEPTQQPVDNPTPVEPPAPTPVEQTVQEQLKEQMSNPIPEISAAAIGESAKQAVAATAKFVKDLFTNPAAAGKALLAIGSSMSEEERAAARPVVIATVVVNIISSSVTGMTIRGVKF